MKHLYPVRLLGLLVLAGSAGLALRVAPPAAEPTPSPTVPAAAAPTGVRTVERQANVFTYNRQEAPSVDLDRDGTVLAVWGSRRQEAGTFGVYGRLFDRAGNARSGEIHVNEHMESSQEAPSVSFGPGGAAWVVWQSYGQDGDAGAIIARRFGREGELFTALGGEIIVNQSAAGDQTEPAVAVGPDGALVTWTTVMADRRQVVAARLFDGAGAPVTGEFRLGDGDEVNEGLAAVASQGQAGFVVAWAARAMDGTPLGIRARRIGAGGTRLGEEISVAASAGGRQDVEPSVDADDSGRFVVAWMSARNSRGYDVEARRFDAGGAAEGAPFPVAAVDEQGADGWLSGAAVAMAPDGRFVVAYNVDGIDAHGGEDGGPAATADVCARWFDAGGAPIGEARRLNATAEGRQSLNIASNARRIAWGRDDRLALAWNGRAGGDERGVGVTMVGPENTPPALAALTVDEGILSRAAITEDRIGEPVPPDFDPNFVPEPWDKVTLAPGQDFGFIGFQNTGWNPPDPDIAVGPNHVEVAVNGGIRVYTKDGTLKFVRTLVGSNGFWGAQGAGNFVFDPVEVYDPLSNRFIVVTAEHRGSQNAFLLLAVSNSDDPSDPNAWHKYRWNLISLAGFIDFPNVGVGPEAIYVTTDFFSPQKNFIHIIDKAKAMNGDPIAAPTSILTASSFRSLGTVKTYDADAPVQYFASAHGGSSTSILLQSIQNPLGSPILKSTQLTVGFYQNPPDARQRGSSNRVATVDRRIKNGVFRNGHLWLSHTIGNGGIARVRWYEIDMRGWPLSGMNPVLLQEGTQNLGSDIYNWFPDIDVDEFGDAAIGFNRSSPNEFVSIQRTFRLVDDPPGTMRAPETMQTSTSAEQGSRWGDYGGIHQDPAEPGMFWTHHEYRTSSWRTWVGRFEVPAVNPCPEDLDGSGAIDFGDLLAILSAWGPCQECPEDLDNSGAADFGDILIVLGSWGACP